MRVVAIINTCIGGSTGKIAVGLYRHLTGSGTVCHFCYGREDGPVHENYYHIGRRVHAVLHAAITRVFGLQGFGSVLPTRRLISYLRKNRVDTVFLLSPHGYYLNEPLFFRYLAEDGIRLIYLMIDEYPFTGKCTYCNGCTGYLTECRGRCPEKREYPKSLLFNGASALFRMKKAAYASLDSSVFVGPGYVVAQAKDSPLLQNKRLEVLDEAIDTAFYSPRDCAALREELGIRPEQKVLVCVAPYSLERKGCRYFVELARRFAGDPDYVFVHVGFDVESGTVSLPPNYIPVGFLRDQEKLAQYYSLGDLFVFPSLLDTMPNACLEALACGTPLLCFDVSGMPYIADESVAVFVEPRNVDQLEQAVRAAPRKTSETIEICHKYALSRYDSRLYYQKLSAIAENDRGFNT